MRLNEKIKAIFKLVLNQITEVYWYFLVFYLVCLVLFLFFKSWKLFFNWPVFHISVVILGVLALLSEKGRRFFLIRRRLTREEFTHFITKFKLSEIGYIKIGFIIIILSYSLYKGLGPIDFLVFGYALISVLFILESRIAAVIALLFLVSCPVLLILKKEPIAETMAIYVYYFLVIAIATQLREYWREERAKKVIHS